MCHIREEKMDQGCDAISVVSHASDTSLYDHNVLYIRRRMMMMKNRRDVLLMMIKSDERCNPSNKP